MGYVKNEKKNIDISNHYIGISRKEKTHHSFRGNGELLDL